MMNKKQNTVGNIHKHIKLNEEKIIFCENTNWNLVLNIMVEI